MNEFNCLSVLEKGLDDMPYGKEMIYEIIRKYGNEPAANQILYWLDESEYSTLAWKNKHIEMGETEKADQEMKKLNTLSRARELITPYVPARKDESGSL